LHSLLLLWSQTSSNLSQVDVGSLHKRFHRIDNFGSGLALKCLRFKGLSYEVENLDGLANDGRVLPNVMSDAHSTETKMRWQ
jgi:hypothetical protein